MPQIARSALVMHSDQRMFDLVHDVRRYPEFLPWCSESHIISEDDHQLVAGLTIQKGSLSQTFTTRNTLQPPESMTLELVKGPFKSLSGVWRFQSLESNACKVTLELDFEVSGKILSMALTPIFKQAANTMVEAFVNRANSLYKD